MEFSASLGVFLAVSCVMVVAPHAKARCYPSALPPEARNSSGHATLEDCEEAQRVFRYPSSCVCDEPTKSDVERAFRKMGAQVDFGLERIDGEEGAPVLRVTNGSSYEIQRVAYEVAYYAGGQKICEHWNMWHDCDLAPGETVLLLEDIASDDERNGTDCRFRFQSLTGSDDVVLRLLWVRVEKAKIDGHTSDDGRWKIERAR